MLEIKRLDNYNFILAERLDEPTTRSIAGNEIVYTHKNLSKFYGSLYYALRGYFSHLGVNVPLIDESLKSVRPTSEKSLYQDYLECELSGRFDNE